MTRSGLVIVVVYKISQMSRHNRSFPFARRIHREVNYYEQRSMSNHDPARQTASSTGRGGTKKTAQKNRTFCISRYRQRSSLLPTVSAYRFTGHMPFLGIHDSGATPLPRNPRTQTWVDDHRSPVYLSGEGRGGIMNRMNRYVTSAIECRSSNWYMINLMHSIECTTTPLQSTGG